MDNTREKLIELLKSGGVRGFPFNAALADHLIANGVTIQKWIPVTERLPDKDTLVLCIGSKGGMFLGYVRSLYGDETTAYTIVPNARGGRYTKYWMPLPEPPKGD